MDVHGPVVSRLNGEERQQSDADVVEVEWRLSPMSRSWDRRQFTVVDEFASGVVQH